MSYLNISSPIYIRKGRNNSFSFEFELAPSLVILSETPFSRKANRNHQNGIKMFTSCFAEQFIKSARNDLQRKPFRAAKSLFPFFPPSNLLNPQMSVSACGGVKFIDELDSLPATFAFIIVIRMKVASCYCLEIPSFRGALHCVFALNGSRW